MILLSMLIAGVPRVSADDANVVGGIPVYHRFFDPPTINGKPTKSEWPPRGFTLRLKTPLDIWLGAERYIIGFEDIDNMELRTDIWNVSYEFPFFGTSRLALGLGAGTNKLVNLVPGEDSGWFSVTQMLLELVYPFSDTIIVSFGYRRIWSKKTFELTFADGTEFETDPVDYGGEVLGLALAFSFSL
ncbi:MAG: hypothetical protein GY866_14395 [Proteobacteria bacterium]|nr:hypothetical protein [Pseudomonadota bacterium]